MDINWLKWKSLGGHSGRQTLSYLYLGQIHRISLMASLWHPILALLPRGRYKVFQIFFRNKICLEQNAIQGKYDIKEQIKCRKQTTECCLLGSHDLLGHWLSKTNCWMHQSRELIYKLESLDQLSQATFSWRLHLYFSLAMLKERD